MLESKLLSKSPEMKCADSNRKSEGLQANFFAIGGKQLKAKVQCDLAGWMAIFAWSGNGGSYLIAYLKIR